MKALWTPPRAGTIRILSAGFCLAALLLLGAARVLPEDALSAGPAPFGPSPTATSRRGVVSSAEIGASRAGAAVLAEGGNAVDAAVATAFALAVTYPQAGNLAGGGFAVGRTRNGDVFALDFRETAPAGTWERTFLHPDGSRRGDASLVGGLSVATPGTVRGLEELHRRLGRLPWARLVAPAAELARDGFRVPEPMRADLARQAARLRASPETRRIFFRGDEPVPAGELLVQPELAATLEAIASGGADAFHRGSVARLLAERVRATGGVLTEEDLAAYRPVWRPPVVFDFDRWRLVTLPPPSAGGFVLMSALGQLAAAPVDLRSLDEAGRVHLVSEAMKRAFADRNEYVGDPDCVSMPLAALLAPARLAALGASLRLDRVTPSSAIQAGAVPREGDQTTHFSVATADGEAVAVTYTLNETFGNGDVVPGVGVLLNNEMDDFATQPGRPNLFGLIQGTSNAVRGGARPVSSMCPTVVLEDGRPRFVLGSPGGSTIPSAVLEVFLRAGPLGQPLPAAVAGPRFHHQHLPDELVVEKEAWPAADLEELRRRGHVIRQRTLIGVVHAISFERDGTLLGVADPRLYGRPVSAEQSSRP